MHDKNAISHAGKPKKKITLNFKNGSSIEFKENDKNVNWQAVDSVLYEQWLTKEELKKLYPDIKL